MPSSLLSPGASAPPWGWRQLCPKCHGPIRLPASSQSPVPCENYPCFPKEALIFLVGGGCHHGDWSRRDPGVESRMQGRSFVKCGVAPSPSHTTFRDTGQEPLTSFPISGAAEGRDKSWETCSAPTSTGRCFYSAPHRVFLRAGEPKQSTKPICNIPRSPRKPGSSITPGP